MEIQFDGIGRPVLEGRAAQCFVRNKLLIAALRRGESDDWDGPLGSAAGLALGTDELSFLMSVAYVNEVLIARECEAMGFEDFSVEQVRRDFGLR